MKSVSTKSKVSSLVKLNLQALGLVMENKWLSNEIFADSYDRLSEKYDSSWRRHIEGVTLSLLDRIQVKDAARIIDLGCGTGLSSRRLAAEFPMASVKGIDISEGMLDVAEGISGPPNIRYLTADMLKYLEKTKPSSCDMVFSAWAIGYSKPVQILANSARVLRAGGTLAFIVNYADTLPEVFCAYRKTMLAFPEQMSMAMCPGFPRNRKFLEKHLAASGLSIRHFNDGVVPVSVQRDSSGRALPWLLETGTLAGFDKAMGLDRESRGREYFESCFSDIQTINHHYAEVIAIK